MARVLRSIYAWGEMVKFSHSVFALPYAILASFLAARPRLPGLMQMVLIAACMVAARSAAMTFNRLVDEPFDARNPRTAGRHLPRGAIRRPTAWMFFAVASLLFVALTGGFILLCGNAWPLRLSLPVLALLCLYSYTKRFTRLSHLVLGAAIALSPVAAWIAIQPETLGPPAWLLMAAVTFWIGGFDVIYACQDVAFDRAAGLQSVPARLGIGPALWIARGAHAMTVACLAAVGVAAGLGLWYWIGVGCVAALLLVENLLVRPDDLSRVNLAFFTVNGIVSLVLGGLGVLDICLARMSL